MVLSLLLAASSAVAAGRGHQAMLTLDSHLDTPASLDLPGWRIEDAHDVDIDFTQVDLPRMRKGGLDGGFWVVYTPQGPLDAAGKAAARDFAFRRLLSIRDMVASHGKTMELALTASDALRIAKAGKRVVYISMENAYPLADDPSLARSFHAMGVRMLGLAHFANNQFADSSTDPGGPRWNGLSPLGRELVKEANRLGLVVDASHASDAVLDQLLAQSRAPIILSHSGCKTIYDHPRNVDDVRLRRLAAAGGVIQINSFEHYLKALPRNTERDAALGALSDRIDRPGLSVTEYRALLAERRALVARYPVEHATFDDFMAHLLHALKVVGPDHVGIGLDLDGGGGVAGMKDAGALSRITTALRAAGYDDVAIEKIWSGNLLRVVAAAQAVADPLTP
ncbi:dipeptidase [Rhizorhabdus sp.]|uniref:dipeptidase n=1 Tax=Rhizorhabdus sp. TaxID=1968843 RepID=UPI001B507C6C|nr:dipeptidase [Rhizorhabdus sp.]MBP8234996.1 dipeptidase [Rhizorhabdus sp.]